MSSEWSTPQRPTDAMDESADGSMGLSTVVGSALLVAVAYAMVVGISITVTFWVLDLAFAPVDVPSGVALVVPACISVVAVLASRRLAGAVRMFWGRPG